MITITKELTVTAGSAPYNYAWINSSSCAVIANPTGISLDGVISTTITFADDYCLNNTSLQILIVDSNNCTNTFDVELNSPCGDLLVTEIQYGGDYEFSILASGGTPSYTYLWQYDSVRFTALNTDQSYLSLTPSSSFNGDTSTTVKCTVTDTKGCKKVKTYTLNFCAPTGPAQYVSLVCSATVNQAHKNHIVLQATTCSSSDILWDTLTFSGFNQAIDIEIGNYPTEPEAIDIVANLNQIVPGTYTGHYTVYNTYNAFVTIPLTIFIPDCSNPLPIYGVDYSVGLPCPVAVDDTWTINLENYVFSDTAIDWSTFEFLPLTGQSNPTQNTLIGAMGTYVLDLDHNLTLTVAHTNVASEVVRWTVCNEDDSCTPAITFTFIINCTSLPIANADSFCAVCGQATPYVDILANDVGPFTASTVTITVPPMHGSVVVAPAGTISYTPNSTFSGTDMLTYTVTNTPTGITSNPAIVSFNVLCAGTDST